MPTHTLPITIILSLHENDTLFAESLFFAEILRYDDKEAGVVESLKANVKKFAEGMPPLELHRRHPAGEPVIRELSLTLHPPETAEGRSKCWHTPVELKFKAVAWLHGDAAAILYIPALGIEVCSTKPAAIEAAEQMAVKQIRAELSRRGATASFERLALLQRNRDLRLVSDSIELQLRTSKQIAARAEEREEQKKSALAEATTDLTKESLPAAFEMDETVAQIAEALTGRAPRSVLLVGRSGVGKTAALHELIRRRDEFQLAHTPFHATNGSRLVAGMSGFGQWQERCTRLWREAAAQRAILSLGNLIELMEVGKYIGNTQGIADFLRPYIARGDVLAVAECTPEQVSFIERINPRLLDTFHQIKIEEPSPERGRNILLGYAVAESRPSDVRMPEIQIDAIERIDQLHRRYATYSASPGRPLRFLKNLLLDASADEAISAEHVTNAFSRETGLPRVLLDERERLDLAAAREWFAARVTGQPEAVDLVVDLLATVKAELMRPRKPIASLLFIGPTGVGKTEMAKSLAEFLFRERDRMIRFDMSEYADPVAVRRLVGGISGKEGLLTARVREQPFSVVLLDEFEKADPSFFDLLLQVLGEGRLTDAMGRVADFSNSVVIMTSNLGAQSFQRGISGFGSPRATRDAASKHFTTAVRQALRPEMFNRIDRIVPFAPLDEETVLKIAEREIELIRSRDGIRFRRLELKIWDGVAKHLAHRGYDVRYGARPLKRAIERLMLLPLAEELNRRPADERSQANLYLEADHLKLSVVKDTAAKLSSTMFDDPSLAWIVRKWSALRRETQSLERSSTMRNLQNEIFALERLEKRLKKSKWQSPEDLERLARLPKLNELVSGAKSDGAAITKYEEAALLALYAKEQISVPDTASLLAETSAAWNQLLIRLYSSSFKKPDSITLAIFGEDYRRIFELARVYFAFATSKEALISLHQFTLKPDPQSRKARKKKAPEESRFERKLIEKPAGYLEQPQAAAFCLAIGINFPHAYPTLHIERGLHTFVEEKKSVRCLVEASDIAPASYAPPAEMIRQGAIERQEKRRSYSLDTSLIEDPLLGLRQPWSGRDTAEQMCELIEKSLLSKARALLEGGTF